MPPENLRLFRNKKSTKSCRYTWSKSVSNFISLYAATELLAYYNKLCPQCRSFNLMKMIN